LFSLMGGRGKTRQGGVKLPKRSLTFRKVIRGVRIG